MFKAYTSHTDTLVMAVRQFVLFEHAAVIAPRQSNTLVMFSLTKQRLWPLINAKSLLCCLPVLFGVLSVSLLTLCVYLPRQTQVRTSIHSLLLFPRLGFLSLQAKATEACRWQIMTVLSPLATSLCLCQQWGVQLHLTTSLLDHWLAYYSNDFLSANCGIAFSPLV